MTTIKLYELSRGNDGNVKWKGPDGKVHDLDVLGASPSIWKIENDSNGKPVMAYKPGTPGTDGTIVVSIDGAPSKMATLLHNEDDFPRKVYFATDGGNNNPLKRPAFILRVEGISDSPVQRWSNYRVMVVK